MELIVLCAPPGAGKSTLSATFKNHIIINQDTLGRDGHLIEFTKTLNSQKDIIIDRMDFSKEQRNHYLEPAKKAGYKTKIIVLHENHETCFERMKNRQDHPTIKDEKTASKVLNFFFSKYERPTLDEADEIEFRYPEGEKPLAVICDLDGTLCNIEHRLHFIKDPGKKDWRSFSESLRTDTVNEWCKDILKQFSNDDFGGGYKIVLCSGRADNYRELTKNWLTENSCGYDNLFMRKRDDYRKDNIIKEVILDFEILTRYKPYFFIDDRQQVINLWRRRGFIALQCSKGDF